MAQAYYSRGYTRVFHGELQGGGSQGDIVLCADLRHRTDRLDHLARGFLISVASVNVWAFGEDAAAVGGGVKDGHRKLDGPIEEGDSGAVDQGVAVVSDRGLKRTGLDVPNHQ